MNHEKNLNTINIFYLNIMFCLLTITVRNLINFLILHGVLLSTINYKIGVNFLLNKINISFDVGIDAWSLVRWCIGVISATFLVVALGCWHRRIHLSSNFKKSFNPFCPRMSAFVEKFVQISLNMIRSNTVSWNMCSNFSPNALYMLSMSTCK